MAETGAFPRRHARTRGFTLGRPRGFAVGADDARVAFLRSTAGDDPVNRLWVLDLAGGGERLVADPAALPGGSGERRGGPGTPRGSPGGPRLESRSGISDCPICE